MAGQEPPHIAAASEASTPSEAIAELKEALGPQHGGLVLIFHSVAHDPQVIAASAKQAFPDSLVCGCTTMGEIGPLGLTREAVAALALKAPARAAAVVVTQAERVHNFQHGARILDELCARLDLEAPLLDAERHVLLSFTEGLQGNEERLIASLGFAAPRVPLVGGSAGDDFHMERTWVHLDGQAYPHASLVLLLEPGVPFRAFALHHYHPKERRVVVTKADPERRRVYELNGWPARRVLADTMGVEEEALIQDPVLVSRLAHAFSYSVGGELFMRSVMAVEGEALIMGGAVEEGVVLRLMDGADLVSETRSGLARELEALAGEPSALLLFNCGGRLLLSQAEGSEAALHEAMSPVPAAGFSTYGEQFGPLHINQTLTGLLLAR